MPYTFVFHLTSFITLEGLLFWQISLFEIKKNRLYTFAVFPYYIEWAVEGFRFLNQNPDSDLRWTGGLLDQFNAVIFSHSLNIIFFSEHICLINMKSGNIFSKLKSFIWSEMILLGSEYQFWFCVVHLKLVCYNNIIKVG